MIEYFDECVGCDLPCFSTCKYKNVPHHCCDECGEYETQLYYFEDEELCINCIKNRLEKVN